MDQGLRLPWRLGLDLITFEQQLGSTSHPGLGIGMHGAERLPGSNPISKLALQNDSDRGIDRIFFLFASAAENHARTANRLTIHGRDVTFLHADHVVPVFRSRQFRRIVDHAGVSSLQHYHLAKLFERLAGRYELLGLELALLDGHYRTAQMKHPAGELEAQL